MKTNVIDFAARKKRFDLGTIYVGDEIEWKDYTGDVIRGRVTGIEEMLWADAEFKCRATRIPRNEADLNRKHSYCFYLENGLSIAGVALERKRSPKKKVAGAKA